MCFRGSVLDFSFPGCLPSYDKGELARGGELAEAELENGAESVPAFTGIW